MSDIDWGKVLLATIQGGLIGVGLYYVNRWQQRRKERAASQSDVPSSSPVTTDRLASPASPTPAPVAPESSSPNSATGSNGEEPQYCSQCNQPVVATAKFCGGCGAAIQSPVVQKPSAPILRSPRLAPVTPTPAPVEDAQPATPPAGNTGRTKPVWGALQWGMALFPLAIIVALVAILFTLAMSTQQPASYAERGNTAATDPIRLRLAADQGDAGAQTNLGIMYASGNGVPQDDAEAVRLYRLAADQGNPLAQANLGYMYDTGRGVPQDAAEALRLYRLAADQGYANAQSNLGVKYADGDGVPQSDTEAVRWYRLAAEQGDADAQYNLGYMYGTGRGVPQDDVQAVRWYRLAADQGNAVAQRNLGNTYNNGRGVPQDAVQAYKWYSLAAARSTGTARDDAARSRDQIANRLTPDQRAEAQRLAREWDEAHPR